VVWNGHVEDVDQEDDEIGDGHADESLTIEEDIAYHGSCNDSNASSKSVQILESGLNRERRYRVHILIRIVIYSD